MVSVSPWSINLKNINHGDTETTEETQKSSKLGLASPGFPRGYEELGMAYARKKLYAEAQNKFEKAVQLSRRGRRGLSFLGWVLATTGKRDEALAIIKELEGKYEKGEALA